MKRIGKNDYIFITDNALVTIGNVSKEVKSPKNPEYVPRKYCKSI